MITDFILPPQPGLFPTPTGHPIAFESGIISFSNGIATSINKTFTEWGEILPIILIALAVFLIGLVLGYFVEWIFKTLGQKLRLSVLWKKIEFDQFLNRAGIKTSPTQLVGKSLKGVIITYFLRVSVGILGFHEVEHFLGQVIQFVPKVVIALLILLFAIKAANTASSLTSNLLRIGDQHSRIIIAAVIKNILITFGIMAALVEIQIAEQLVSILFTAFVAMLALAGGLAFGLGGKDFVHDLLNELKAKNLKGTVVKPTDISS